MALALLRSGFTVTSGISATAGERNTAMEISVISSNTINSTNVHGLVAVTLCANRFSAELTNAT